MADRVSTVIDLRPTLQEPGDRFSRVTGGCDWPVLFAEMSAAANIEPPGPFNHGLPWLSIQIYPR